MQENGNSCLGSLGKLISPPPYHKRLSSTGLEPVAKGDFSNSLIVSFGHPFAPQSIGGNCVGSELSLEFVGRAIGLKRLQHATGGRVLYVFMLGGATTFLGVGEEEALRNTALFNCCLRRLSFGFSCALDSAQVNRVISDDPLGAYLSHRDTLWVRILESEKLANPDAFVLRSLRAIKDDPCSVRNFGESTLRDGWLQTQSSPGASMGVLWSRPPVNLAGQFTNEGIIGSDELQHRISVSKPMSLDRYFPIERPPDLAGYLYLGGLLKCARDILPAHVLPPRNDSRFSDEQKIAAKIRGGKSGSPVSARTLNHLWELLRLRLKMEIPALLDLVSVSKSEVRQEIQRLMDEATSPHPSFAILK